MYHENQFKTLLEEKNLKNILRNTVGRDVKRTGEDA